VQLLVVLVALLLAGLQALKHRDKSGSDVFMASSDGQRLGSAIWQLSDAGVFLDTIHLYGIFSGELHDQPAAGGQQPCRSQTNNAGCLTRFKIASGGRDIHL
jgi:hypothetical protein